MSFHTINNCLKKARFNSYLKIIFFDLKRISCTKFFTAYFHAQKFLIQPEGQICMFNYVRKFIALTSVVVEKCVYIVCRSKVFSYNPDIVCLSTVPIYWFISGTFYPFLPTGNSSNMKKLFMTLTIKNCYRSKYKII